MSKSIGGTWRLALLPALSVVQICGSAQAQSVPGQVSRDAQRILEQQQQQARERAEQFQDRQDRPPSGEVLEQSPEAVGTDGGCTAVHAVRIVGMTRYRDTDFNGEIGSLNGPCTSISAIDLALRAITNRYVKDGFVTSRAFVGPQDLKAGALTITVIEGRVSNLQPVADPDGGKRYGPREIAAAFPTGSGKILNLRALEQGVDQLARMGKGDPKIDIAPGETPGTSTVLIKRQPLARWVRPSLVFNNEGAASTGRWQGTAGLDVDSLLGFGEAWSFYYQRSFQYGAERGSHAVGGFVALPHGWWTLSLSGGSSAYHSVLEGNGLRFGSEGRTWNGSATLDRMVYRDASNKLSISAGISLLDTENAIQGIRLQTGSYRIVTAQLGSRWQRRIGKSQFSLAAGYDRGLDILGAETVDTGPGGATGRYDLVTGEAALQTPLAIGPTRLTNTALMRGQWGFDNLFPAQRFSLGGSSTVRGFRDDGISGRSGVLLRDQLSFGITDVAKASPHLASILSGYLAYDIGAIRPHQDDPYERGVLQSLSAGFKAQSRHLQAELSIAVPVSAPSWVRTSTALVSTSIRILL